jgi:SAM-dependent methyltransferase
VEHWFELDDDEFVTRAWRLVLRRDPRDDERERGQERLRTGAVSRARFLRELFESREFEEVESRDDGLARALSEHLRYRDARGPGRPRLLHAPAWSDERAIEIPWVLARYDGERRVLDVGYAFAEPAYLAGIAALGAPELVGVDLARREVPGLEPVVADVRELPFENGSFDLVLCVSTLEHVGRDNEVYDVEARRDDAGDDAALRELRRVLAADGRVLVSVPTGRAEDHGWQVVRTPRQWIERFERAGFVVYEDELYVHADEGWRSATPVDVERSAYGESGPSGGKPGAGAVLLAELRPGSLGGKLRLAVRDVRHRGDVRRSTTAK